MALWEEVSRLAEDFQKVQQSASKQKLSERNVIEIVSKLQALKLVEVIYTTDGKEYITPQELTKEIRDELVVHGGRINLVDLQQILNVDLSHIEVRVGDLIRHDRSLTLVLGQLIDTSYKDRIAEEVNDSLQEEGHVTIPDLTRSYDLPADFIREVLLERLGTIVRGQVDNFDKDVIFTDAFVRRMKARVRGAFSAIKIPTQTSFMISQTGCPERLFFSIVDELIARSRLAGSLTGARHTYLPDCFTKAQNEWVDAFYKQNGYLDYDALTRLGISDVKAYIKRRFKSEPLVFLPTVCVGQALQEQLEASVEEAVATDSWVDVSTLLPSSFSPKDANQLLTACVKGKMGVMICEDNIVASEKMVSESAKLFSDLITAKAEKNSAVHAISVTDDTSAKSLARVVQSEDSKEEKKDQRRKKAAGASSAGGGGKSGGGGGGGSQGREVKTKSTKKKGRGRGDAGSDEEEERAPKVKGGTAGPGDFMSVDEIQEVLQTQERLKECPDDLLNSIASQLYRPLTRQYQETVKSVYLSRTEGAGPGGKKKSAADLQEKISGLWTNVRLFEKGLKLLKEEVQAQLIKHLLKTVCSDIANNIVNAFASDSMMSVFEESAMTPEERLNLISKLPAEVQPELIKLHSCVVKSPTLDDFFSQMEMLCGPRHLGLLLKKPDKKKERQLVFSHRQTLSEQLRGEKEAAMALHLAAVLLFQTFTGCLLHAPGRLVPSITAFLADHLDADKHATLLRLQELVMRDLKQQGEEGKEEEKQEVAEQMKELVPEVVQIALTTKKSTASQDDQ